MITQKSHRVDCERVFVQVVWTRRGVKKFRKKVMLKFFYPVLTEALSHDAQIRSISEPDSRADR